MTTPTEHPGLTINQVPDDADDYLTPQPGRCGVEGHYRYGDMPCNRCIHECIDPEDLERIERERNRESSPDFHPGHGSSPT